MKTNYESVQDQFFLEDILRRASMTTEVLFDPIFTETSDKEYISHVIILRAKIFEYLGRPDPNQDAIDRYFKDYK